MRLRLNLLASGGTSGIQVNDTLTVGGITYTGKAIETIGSAQFRVFTSPSFTFVAADVNTATETITKTSHGLQDGDPITVSNAGGALPTGLLAATTYYVISATANTFKLSTSLGGSALDITAGGSGTNTLAVSRSPAQNIRETSLSLIRVINRYASSVVIATYLSGPDDLPGKLLLEEEGIGGSAFALTSTRATCWSPSLPSSGTTESSSNDVRKNGVNYSKSLQPEAVPLPNNRYAGSKDKEILRGIPLRDKLILFKEDGIYSINSYTFEVELLDSTAILISPETAVVLNNQILCLTTQGVVAVTDTGVSVISRQIENTLLELQGLNPTTLKNESFAISYESERKYILFVPSVQGDTTPTQAFVYNVFTNTWTRWPLTKMCGGVNPANDRLYLGSATSPYVDIERKTFRAQDFVDFGFTTTISAINGRVLSLGQVDQINRGDIIYQSASIFSVVESTDVVNGTVTVTNNSPFVVGTVDVLKAIATRVGWVPITLGNPGILKQFYEIMVMLSQPFYGEASLVFTTDLSPARETEIITGIITGQWGLFGWGLAPWGGGTKRKPYRVMVPRNKQRATMLMIEFRHSTGYARYSLNGLSIQANPGSSKAGRS